MTAVSQTAYLPQIGGRHLDAANKTQNENPRDIDQNAYRLPLGVTAQKSGETPLAAFSPTRDAPANGYGATRVPGMLGELPGRMRRSRPGSIYKMQLGSQDVQTLVQRLIASGTSTNLGKRDLEALIAPAALGISQHQRSANEEDAQPSESIWSDDANGAKTIPYPPPPETGGPYRMPTISTPILQQNVRLDAIIGLLNKAMGPEGRGYGGNGRGNLRAHDRALYSFDTDDRHGGFERNLLDIQKLFERAKNFDDRTQSTTSLLAGDLDKGGKRRKAEKSPTTATHHQSPMFDMQLENKTLAGRKPIRVIAAELEKRIETLKTNQSEWDLFQNRISDYRAMDLNRARTAPADMVRANKLTVQEQLPQVRRQRLASAREQRSHHMQEIRSRKRAQDLEKWREKMAALAKKETAVEALRLKEKEQLGRGEAMQKKWFMLTAVASRMTMIQIVLETERQRRAINYLHGHLARLIQRTWRRYIRKKQEADKITALAKIAVVFRKYVARRRELQRHLAADTIRQFLRDVYDVSRLMKVVKKYRFSVVKAQNIVLAWHAIRNAQVDVVCKYWDKLEPAWWNQRKGADADDKKDKGKSKKSRGKSRKDDHGDKIPLNVTGDIKRNVVLTDLIQRRKVHRVALAKWEQDLGTYSASHKNGKIDPGAPKRPVFKLLPHQADMLQLIEKGFLEAASSNWK
ncbi:uncharacterized protein EV422DRAFT_393206 [Fimicolochytrium jonesii]|uniref:uncharacterized protein n=1 Tax=Fimicolochytrium jonesii TaxID=1396493 RepID=UPI0022FE1167|nr:uncharacterized protein EV422DRAFT_393206 [Fimicolochytrium jonesii]KAI8823134.1 hypothetical protein EV422DRAFT_393206 [Fimicolochytrium jonesii]